MEFVKTCFIIVLFALLILISVKKAPCNCAEVNTETSTGTTDTISLVDSATISLFKQQLKASAIENGKLQCEIIRLSGIVSDTIKYKSWSDKENLITKF